MEKTKIFEMTDRLKTLQEQKKDLDAAGTDIDKLKTFFEKYFGIGGSASFTEPEHKVVRYDWNGQEGLDMVAESKAPYGKKQ